MASFLIFCVYNSFAHTIEISIKLEEIETDYTQKFVEFSVRKQVSKFVHRRLQSPP